LDNAYAQFNLAQMYQYGYGVAADAGQVSKWLQRAAQQGHALAIKELGQLR